MAGMTQGKCRSICWKGAAGAGALLFVLLFLTTGLGFFSALLTGLIGYGVMGVGLTRLVCGDSRDGPVSRSAAAASTSTAAAPAGTGVAPTPQPAPEPAPEVAQQPRAVRVSPSAPLAGEAELAGRKGSYRYEGTPKPARAEEAGPAEEAPAKPAPAAAPAAPTRPLITPSAVLAGEAELSTRKGSWRYEPGRR
ncbi:hypothetical protein [Marinovum sp.]|uniref:hypothetical protein n=1 Tax=Marinovum sp. TaxID=2024839 RepID=UPI002B26E861|nr:hypothetical protein [Marinovum sp.]